MVDLENKINANKDNLAAVMVTYPSTHGVFEEGITKLCEMVQDAGGQVYGCNHRSVYLEKLQ